MGSMSLTLHSPIWSTGNSIERGQAHSWGSDCGLVETNGIYYGKLMPGDFHLHYFPPSKVPYSSFFRMRGLRLEECMYLAQLG